MGFWSRSIPLSTASINRESINGGRSPVLGIGAQRAPGARRLVQCAGRSLPAEAMAPARPQARPVCRPRRRPGQHSRVFFYVNILNIVEIWVLYQNKEVIFYPISRFSEFLFSIMQAGDALIQLYHSFITGFETKINLLKLAHIAVTVSRQYLEKEAAIAYLEGVIEKLRATKEPRIEEPIIYVKMQIAALNLETGNQKDCKRFLEEGKAALDSMTDIDPSVHASFFWVSSLDRKSRQEFSAFYKDTLLYLAYTSVELNLFRKCSRWYGFLKLQ